MTLNPDKAKVLLVGSNLTLGNGVTLVLDGAALPLKAHVHRLGVFLDVFVDRSVYYQFRRGQELRSFLGKKILPRLLMPASHPGSIIVTRSM